MALLTKTLVGGTQIFSLSRARDNISSLSCFRVSIRYRNTRESLGELQKLLTLFRPGGGGEGESARADFERL